MNFFELLKGNNSFSEWFYASALALLGFFLLKLLQFENRREKTINFKFYYWWIDNKIEFMIGLIMFYVLFRFYADLENYISQAPILGKFISNKFLIVFIFGLIFQLILKKMRIILKIRHKEYPSGTKRKEYIN